MDYRIRSKKGSAKQNLGLDQAILKTVLSNQEN